MKLRSLSIALAALLAPVAWAPSRPARAAAPAGTVKVFLLIGQSNMQGKGSLKHLDQLVKSDPAVYGHLKKDGRWVERNDVWIFFGDLGGRAKDRHGRLTVGYGFPAGRFGPELGFGDVVGDAIAEPVVLLKACWGGQSLAVDFRPPSAGHWTKPLNPDDDVQGKPGTVGWGYKQIFNEKHHALDNLGKTFPELKGRKYELAGVVWFQGWNDLIDGKRRAEYASNLAHFIRDLRKDLKAPNLPFVIGVVGHDGAKPNQSVAELQKAQMAVAEMPEFKGNVIAVPTAPYWDPSVKYEGGYHYNGSARFYYQAGEAFGKAMLKLLKTPPAK